MGVVRFNKKGVLWIVLSTIVAISSCTAYYLPYWITAVHYGSRYLIYYSSHKSCHYRLGETNSLVLEYCKRQSMALTQDHQSFPWWTISTILIGGGCYIFLFVAFILLLSTIIPHSISNVSLKLVGICQAIGGLILSVGLMVFPLGFDNGSLSSSCPGSSVYQLGSNCHISPCVHILIISSVFGIIISLLSSNACDNNYYDNFYRVYNTSDVKQLHLLAGVYNPTIHPIVRL